MDKYTWRFPKGFEIPGSNENGDHVLKLLKNIYGLKQAGRLWNKHIHTGLLELK